MAIGMRKRSVVGIGGLALALVAGCSADTGSEDPAATDEASEALRGGRRPGRGFDYRGPRPHPRHRHGDCGQGGTGGTGGSSGKGGSAGKGGGPGKGGTSGTGGAGGASACTVVGPMLLDDFDDGDVLTSSAPQGAWFSANDATAGAVQDPNPWVPTAGGAGGSGFAACTNGSGFLNWGALVGMVFPTEVENVLVCADVSATRGVRFKARGTGLVRLNVQTRATTSVDFGGTCTGTACDYYPNAALFLTADWQTVEVPWSAVMPGNLPFDPREMLGLQFQAYDPAFPANAPIAFDFCVDDIELF
jgi:hypothetical protein